MSQRCFALILNASGGTRFIGLYLARQLVEAGHEVTLFTRGKKKIAYEIPDDTPESYAKFSRSIRHIQGDRMVRQQKKEDFVCMGTIEPPQS